MDRENTDFVRLDLDRKSRTGFAEVVYCAGKTPEQIAVIFQKLLEAEGEAFGTRSSIEQAEAVKKLLPNVDYDPVSRILKAGGKKEKEAVGRIAVCAAGTSDLPVAEEAARTAEFFGNRVDRFIDIGISGLHRLLDRIGEIRKANAVIAVAGMEGALPSVLGGLVAVPVIAVPTSVGYGASFGGAAALLAMLNSCANGISVVNIDNGYGAGYIASQINRLASR
ncbi:MAG: nickel pincer cofactor biosynthesis protein LarB [Lachnospiraceae bacterium]|nr:nickel pincer cofactor biosynthesis protein LarB [Lachnospiraceae bacterium]